MLSQGCAPRGDGLLDEHRNIKSHPTHPHQTSPRILSRGPRQLVAPRFLPSYFAAGCCFRLRFALVFFTAREGRPLVCSVACAWVGQVDEGEGARRQN